MDGTLLPQFPTFMVILDSSLSILLYGEILLSHHYKIALIMSSDLATQVGDTDAEAWLRVLPSSLKWSLHL